MNKILLSLVLSISFLHAFSQQDSLLKKFKYRINHYRSIDFNISGSSQLNRFPVIAVAVTNSSSTGSFWRQLGIVFCHRVSLNTCFAFAICLVGVWQ